MITHHPHYTSPRSSFTKLSRALLSRALLLLALGTLPASAATITWGTPTAPVADTDVSTVGAAVEAWNLGAGFSDVAVNGVTFKAFNVPSNFTSSPITVGRLTLSVNTGMIGGVDPNFSPNSPFGALPAAIRSLLGSLAYISPGGGTLAFSGLTPGAKYAVQIWSLTPTGNAPYTTALTAGNTVSLITNPGNGGQVGQYVVGTFTADAPSQSITFLGTVGFEYSAISATQLRLLEEAPSLVVTTASDASTATDGQTSLREAIAYVNSGNAGANPQITFSNTTANGAVNFHDGATHTVRIAGGAPVFFRSATVTGPGADKLTLDGQLTSTILAVGDSQAVVTLSGLKITRADSSGGSGTLSNNGTLTINDCVLTGNSGQTGSGAVFNNGTLVMNNCTVSDNTSQNSAGAIFNNGATTLTRCTVSGNRSSQNGGAFFNNGTFTVIDSTLSGNQSNSNGGVFFTNGACVFINCTLSGNRSNNSSGGVGSMTSGSSVTLRQCTITGNSAKTSAGAFFNAGGSLTATNSILLFNEANATPDDIVLLGGTQSLTNGLQGSLVPSTVFAQVSTDPLTGIQTGTLASNGGPTATIALAVNSPAVDAGATALAVDQNSQPLANDQRGQPRLKGTSVDIGAFESAPPILHVNASVSGGNGSGDSWANAYRELRDALAVALVNPTTTQIWVASGTYKPAVPNGSRSATFQLRSGLAIYGGFAGTETLVTQRNSNPATNGTVLSGDLDGLNSGAADVSNPTRADNSYHVVTGSGTDATAVLDGFTVTAGNANGSSTQGNGGGLYTSSGSPSLRNVIFSGNSAFGGGGGILNSNNSSLTLANVTFNGNSTSSAGGGIYNFNNSSLTLTNVTFSGNSASLGGGVYNNSSSSTLTNVIFSSNSAENFGGGIYNVSSSPTLTNVIFSGNSASNGSGGGIYNLTNSNPTLTNVTFSGNSAISGGGIYNNNSSPTLTNATFSGNSAGLGGGIYSVSSSPTLRNCILWGDSGGEISQAGATTTVTYSIVQGGFTGTGNLSLDPLFITPITVAAPTTTGNLRLRSGSPAINTGNNSVTNPSLASTDLDGNPRIAATTVDMGAYEFTAPTFANSSLGVVVGSTTPLNLATATGPSPTGGTFSGSHVTSGSFDPTGLAPGTQVTITYTAPSGYSATVTVTINEQPRLIVTTASDVVSNTDGLTSLREAIAYANSNPGADTITFGDGSSITDGTNFLDGTPDTVLLTTIGDGTAGPSALGITTVISIVGSTTGGVTVQGGGANSNLRAFYVASTGSLSLQNLTVDGFRHKGGGSNRGGAAAGMGGAIFNNGGSVALVSTTFTNNVAQGGGFGSFSDGGGGLGGNSIGNFGGGGPNPGGGDVNNGASGGFGGGGNAYGGNGGFGGGGAFSGTGGFGGGVGAFTPGGFGGGNGNTFGAGGGAGMGGAIFLNGGTITVTNSSFQGNAAIAGALTGEGQSLGGVIFARNGSVTINNSTLSGNTAASGGRGAYVLSDASNGGNNSSPGSGSATVVINNTIIGQPDNSVSDFVANTNAGGAAVTISGSNNLIRNNPTTGGFTGGIISSSDPLLGSLANNGGPAQTIALITGSPAIDAGSNALAVDANNVALTTDQRGQPRKIGSTVDIGAVEAAPDILYVNASVSGGTGNGDSWVNAFAKLSDAVAVALGNPTTTQIWVASGTYKPAAPNGDRTATFRLRSGLAIYGGFSGTETLVTQRNSNPATNATVLSGDLNGDDSGFTNNSENSYHVVTGSGTDATALLDGFAVTAGNANGGGNSASFGGGIYNVSSSPTLTNVTFLGNSASSSGGGIYNDSSSPALTNVTFSGNSAGNGGGICDVIDSSPTLTNVTFSGNSANLGGGIYNESSSSPTLSNVTFSSNSANSGGGIYNVSSSSPTLSNVTFSGNSATFGGGGIYNFNSSSPTLTNIAFRGNSSSNFGGGIYNFNSSNPALTNVTFSGNSANRGGGIYNELSSPTLRNSILWGDSGGEIDQNGGSTTVSNSIVQQASGIFPGTGNLNEDPQFVTPITSPAPTTTGNLRLRSTSPAVNAGDNSVVTATTDLDGAARIIGANVDLGAYELFAPPTLTTTQLSLINGGSLSDLAALTGAAPEGGVFSGTGVSVDGGGKYVFDSTGMPSGTQVTITYTVSGPNGTSNTTTATITVLETPSLTVTTTSDPSTNVDGLTSLREAIAHAKTLGGAQTIRFNGDTAALPKATGAGVVDFHDGDTHTLEARSTLVINNQILTVIGTSADRLIFRNVTNTATLISISNGSTVELSGVTVTGSTSSGISSQNSDLTLRGCAVSGNAVDSDNTTGGGIYNFGGDLTLIDSTVSDNAVKGGNRFGGGIYNNRGTVLLKNSTVSGNSLSGNGNNYGAGIYNEIDSTMILVNSTVSGNSSIGGTNVGAGIYSVGTLELTNCTVTNNSASGGADILSGVANLGTAHVRNSIISGNTASAIQDWSGPFATDVNNLIGDQPDLRLAPLGAYGGPTMTHALLPGSSAIDAGDNSLAVDESSAALTNDQRGTGFARIVKGSRTTATATVDIGAFELFAAPEFTTDEFSLSIAAAPLDLIDATGVSPAGGVFSGPGVSGGFFDLATQVPGTYTLTYTLTDAYGVSNTSSLTVTVLSLADLTLTQPKRFKTTVVGTSSRSQRIYIRNLGDQPAKALRVEVGGRAKKDFIVTQPEARLLEPGASTFFQVSFRPREEGKRKAEVTVLSDSSTVSVKLQGRGQAKSGVRPPRAVK